LSDIPNSNIVYLKKEGSLVQQLGVNNEIRPSRSFGANIHELLADSFFIEDGLIGDFAKNKIEKVVTWIKKSRKVDEKGDSYEIDLENNRKLISLIDEPILRSKLSEMISELTGDIELIKNNLQKEIDRLTKKRDSL
jgi:hypothetical protein